MAYYGLITAWNLAGHKKISCNARILQQIQEITVPTGSYQAAWHNIQRSESLRLR